MHKYKQTFIYTASSFLKIQLNITGLLQVKFFYFTYNFYIFHSQNYASSIKLKILSTVQGGENSQALHLITSSQHPGDYKNTYFFL